MLFHTGVILTTPEWRLSFQLKTYESVEKSEYQIAAHFLSVQKWINEHVRSVLDESDAILHAKYQLIYTMGKITFVYFIFITFSS